MTASSATCSPIRRRPIPVEEADDALRRQSVRAAVRALPERERRILELRFGFDGPQQALEAIGKELGITRERVRQLERDALARLAASSETSSRRLPTSSPKPPSRTGHGGPAVGPFGRVRGQTPDTARAAAPRLARRLTVPGTVKKRAEARRIGAISAEVRYLVTDRAAPRCLLSALQRERGELRAADLLAGEHRDAARTRGPERRLAPARRPAPRARPAALRRRPARPSRRRSRRQIWPSSSRNMSSPARPARRASPRAAAGAGAAARRRQRDAA